MIKCTCKKCGKEFLKYPCRIKAGRGSYCSKTCWNNRGDKTEIKCRGCDKKWLVLTSSKGSIPTYCSRECFHKNHNIIKLCVICNTPINLWYSRRHIKTCSRVCAGKVLRIHNVVEYKGIKYYKTRFGYYVSRPKGLHGTMLHRQVYMDHHNVTLEDFHTIHHKDGNRVNNAIENLELWSKRHGAGVRVEDILPKSSTL
jgi:HNH endonuclease